MSISWSKKPDLVTICAWLLHAASWFLPVVKFGGPHWRVFGPVPGWLAFRSALSAVWPYDDIHFDTWYYAVFSTVSAGTTALFILGSPWVVWRGSPSVQRTCAWLAAIALILNSHWYVLFGRDRNSLSIGYYVWWASFGLLSIGLFRLSTHRSGA
jgi:hypothetical protein